MAPEAATKKFVPRRFQGRLNPLRVGVLTLVVLSIFIYLAFSKSLPWQHPFQMNGVFESSSNVSLNSPVRIAGVNVGKVIEVGRKSGTDIAEVTMTIEKQGLPIHKDATMKIRSRLFLEGNLFVDLSPGTPQSPNLEDGGTIPVTQTATPVQLDQILTALQTNDRAALQDLLQGLGAAFTEKPTAKQNAAQDPQVRGKTAAQSLNQTTANAPEALKGTAQVSQALLGKEDDDLAKVVAGLEKVVSALAENETVLADFITNFNSFAAIFAAQESNLRKSIALLGPTVQHASEALESLDQALPELDQFARNLTPVVEQLQPTIRALTPWIKQTRLLVAPDELGGLLKQLRPTAKDLAIVTNDAIPLFKTVNLTSRCFSEVFLPAGNEQVNDARTGRSGTAAYKEFWYAMVGFAGGGAGQDGNGSYLRAGTGGGATTISTGKVKRGVTNGALFGQALSTPLGNQPQKQSKQTPYKLDAKCHKQAKPDLNGKQAQAGPGDAVIP